MEDRLEALERLGRLREQNVLSEAEFESEKARLLATTDPAHPVRDAVVAEGAVRKRRLGLLIGGGAATFLLASVLGGIYVSSSVTSKQTPPKKEEPTAVATDALAAVTSASLTSLLRFDNAADCTFAPGLKSLVDDLRALKPSTEQAPLRIADLGVSVKPNVSQINVGAGSGAIVAELPATGSWDGLQVTGLRTVSFPDRAMYSLRVRFAETPERVARTFGKMGLEFSKAGELKTVEMGDAGLVYGIEATSEGSAFVCGRSEG